MFYYPMSFRVSYQKTICVIFGELIFINLINREMNTENAQQQTPGSDQQVRILYYLNTPLHRS